MSESRTSHSTEAWVADTLRRQILARELLPGMKLRQADLAEEFGVSTTPVREALRTLVAEGLVAIDTHRGAHIRALGADELVEVLELQMTIELSVAPHALAQMTDDVLDKAVALHAAMTGGASPTDFSLLNRDFHTTLASASGRTRSVRWLRELFNVGMIQLHDDIAGWEGRRARGEADHAAMIDAARARDVDRYQQLVREHVVAAVDHLRDTASN